MRFLDEKLEVSGQFRADHAIDPMLNAWASVSRVTQSHQPAKSASQICQPNLHPSPAADPQTMQQSAIWTAELFRPAEFDLD